MLSGLWRPTYGSKRGQMLPYQALFNSAPTSDSERTKDVLCKLRESCCQASFLC